MGKLYCLGDSITAGVPGASWCRYLNHRPLVQDGKGGDTVSGLRQRLKAYNPDPGATWVIEIGANDIMLPFLKTISADWQAGVTTMERKGLEISPDRDSFLMIYQEVLQSLKGARVLCVSIPCIGEDTSSSLNAQVDFYNQGLAELCSQHGGNYVDFNGWQKSAIKQNAPSQPQEPYFIQPERYHMLLDIILCNGLRQTSRLSRRRQLATTVDGVHLNHHGAQNLARLVGELTDSTEGK